MSEDIRNERIIVDVKKAGGLARALKQWKRKSYYLTKELKERKTYTKPSEVKRQTKKKAINLKNWNKKNEQISK